MDREPDDGVRPVHAGAGMPSGSRLGSRVGRYRLRHRLGSGAMGSVWLAEDETLGLQVAIKQIDVPGDPDEDELRQRVSRARAEARNAAQLRGHPHVVNVLDIVEQDGLPWIVMEYVTGACDLRAVIQEQGRLPDTEVARVGIAVLKALSFGHSLGIVHRDVKPANILLAPDHSGSRYGRVMLTDYGISLYPDSGQTRMTDGVIGTPGYMAPERARGAEPPASDLFSVGATLYCASEGRGPFEREGGAAAVAAALTEEPERPGHASRELADVIMGLLAKEPGHRPTVHTALTELAAVETAERGALSSPGRAGDGARGLSIPSSRKVIASAVAGVVALGAVVLTASLLDPDDADPAPTGQGVEGSPSPAGAGGARSNGTGTSGRDRAVAEPGVLHGSDVGLKDPLDAGDCVIIGTHNEDYTQVTDVVVVDCVEEEATPTPAGQVVATVPDSDERSVRQACGKETADLRTSLADPVLTVLRPDTATASSGKQDAACLVFQRGIRAGGALGEHRNPDVSLYVSQLSVGDCIDSDDDIFLADCEKPHDEQVIGHVRVPDTLPYEDLDSQAVCMAKFHDAWVRGDQQKIGAWTNSDDWENGFQVVTCTLEGVAGDKLPGGKATPES